MFDQISTYYQEFLTFTKANPVAAGVVSLYGLGVLTFFLKVIPAKIAHFCRTQFTTNLVLNNFDDVYYDFLEWVSENNMHSFVRNFTFNRRGVYNSGEGEAKISMGYGRVFFFFNRHLFIMNRVKEDSNNIIQTKETITVTVIGRSHKMLEKLFDTIKKKEDDDWLDIRIWRGYYAKLKQNRRPLDTVVLDNKVKNKVLSAIDSFKSDKDWYIENGVPHNLGIMLYGPTGTGKTSFIKALGAYYDMPIYIINVSTVTDHSLQDALFEVPPNSIVALEDIDTANLGKRDLSNRLLPIGDEPEEYMHQSKLQSFSNKEENEYLSLGGVLNAIDGIATQEGRILIATTNDIDSLDEALVRPGRFDVKEEIGYMTDQTLKEYLCRFYDKDFDVKVKPNVAPCKVQRLVFENRNNPEKVLKEIAVV